ncbi:hypothetical protein KAI04_02625 [Candidatus Pacearchaeota archaeon]|nr:hypothetical protein [Candidatus Pacearchaeota archaeon]
MNKKLLFTLGIFLLLIGISFILIEAVEDLETTIITDYSGEVFQIGNLVCPECPSENLIVENVLLRKENSLSTLTFNGEDSKIKVEGNIFENIKKGSTIVFNQDMEIKEAELKISDEFDSKIFINEESFIAPKGSIVIYQEGNLFLKDLSGKEISFNSDLKSFDEIEFVGEGFTIIEKDGNKIPVNSANKINFKVGKDLEEGYYYYPKDTLVSYNGFEILVNKDTIFSLDGKARPGKESISFGPEGNIVLSGNPGMGEFSFSAPDYNQPLTNNYYHLKDSEGRFLYEIASGLYDEEIDSYEKELAISRISSGGKISFEITEPNTELNLFANHPLGDDGSIPGVNIVEGGAKFNFNNVLDIEVNKEGIFESNLEKTDISKIVEFEIYDGSKEENNILIRVGGNGNIIYSPFPKGEFFNYDEIINPIGLKNTFNVLINDADSARIYDFTRLADQSYVTKIKKDASFVFSAGQILDAKRESLGTPLSPNQMRETINKWSQEIGDPSLTIERFYESYKLLENIKKYEGLIRSPREEGKNIEEIYFGPLMSHSCNFFDSSFELWNYYVDVTTKGFGYGEPVVMNRVIF